MKRLLLLCPLFVFVLSLGQAQHLDSFLNDQRFSQIKMRSIGPAFMSGRIADIAIHPNHENTWYVAVGSGGVWKTTNAGTTWKPIFDKQAVYSIGCITIDPQNPNRIWVGTGENVGGRHVSFGDGIYLSEDGGSSWKNMGLTKSEHISEIIVHPENSEIIWVAAQGPLWSSGGERGLYKSIDAGKTWELKLSDNEWTGVTDIALDPRNPNLMYAATWQRHRTVAAYMGGGPGTAIHKSTDGGDSWQKLSKGLPSSNMGKMGIAISPQQPDVLYAAIELNQRKGGVYKSENRGESWKKMSDAVSGGTGPHYYQELYACPHNFDRIYLMDVRIQVSDNGGKNFRRVSENHKHSDNHALIFKKDDPNYLLAGTDGGLYESFDLAKTWRFIDNLPITQYYKVAVDDSEPFYNIYGGTQDNNTQGGPSRTDNVHGIRNADWFITLFGDGHQPATEPGNPDIIYSEWQQGNLCRIDMTTGEIVYIKPQSDVDEDFERYNWDAPILVSQHDPKRLYFGSQRLWRSENRGDTWTALSSDLTRNENRVELPIMGRVQSIDNPWDVYAMSNYNTITSVAESPLNEDVLYVGTDDGLIQTTQNGGQDWRKVDVNQLRGLPNMAFINDMKAGKHNEGTVFLAADNHKQGDYAPYLLKSTDYGKSWNNLTANLPEKLLIWRIVQDHIDPELLFIGTEFGIYFSVNGGDKWIKIKGGVPNISFRDLAIQERENDLVGASFGRSFYVFDDYSFLRGMKNKDLSKEGTLLNTRDALWYIPRPKLSFGGKGSQGAGYYVAPNPAFGATFTYYINNENKTSKKERSKKEKEVKDSDIDFPGWDALAEEEMEEGVRYWLAVQDMEGMTIRRLKAKASKGFHRTSWDLKYPSNNLIRPTDKFNDRQSSYMAPPGTYQVSLVKDDGNEIQTIAGPQSFVVKQLKSGSLDGAEPSAVAGFWRSIEQSQMEAGKLRSTITQAENKINALRIALYKSNLDIGDLDKQLAEAKKTMNGIKTSVMGHPIKNKIGEKNKESIFDRINHAQTGTSRSTYGPLPAHKKSLEIANADMIAVNKSLASLNSTLINIEKALRMAGAPYIEK